MKTIVVANWKMNPKTAKEALTLFEASADAAKTAKNVEVVICPPFVWLGDLLTYSKIKKGLVLGAQNCHWELSGAYTGEVSATMLADIGVRYVIAGHSERRRYLGETDSIINLKIKTALKFELKPILCVGERQGEEMNLMVEEQLTKGLAGLSINQMKEVVIVYEPVWAISTQAGRPCLPDDALSANLFIKRVVTKLYSRFLADKTPVLYGGSVDSGNAVEYIKKAQVNGVLVGGASLDAKEFGALINNLG